MQTKYTLRVSWFTNINNEEDTGTVLLSYQVRPVNEVTLATE